MSPATTWPWKGRVFHIARPRPTLRGSRVSWGEYAQNLHPWDPLQLKNMLIWVWKGIEMKNNSCFNEIEWFFSTMQMIKCTPKHQKQIFLRVRPVVLQVADPQILQFLRCSHTELRATGTWRYTWSSDVLGLTWLIAVFPRNIWRNYGQSVLKFSKIRFYMILPCFIILQNPLYHPFPLMTPSVYLPRKNLLQIGCHNKTGMLMKSRASRSSQSSVARITERSMWQT